MYKVYGITNCDTVKKSLAWLKAHNVAFEFHDYKKLGISKEKLEEWLKQVPWEKLVNKAGTTWKKLDETDKATDSASAIRLMMAKPSVIKRPLIESDKIVLLGFNEKDVAQIQF